LGTNENTSFPATRTDIEFDGWHEPAGKSDASAVPVNAPRNKIEKDLYGIFKFKISCHPFASIVCDHEHLSTHAFLRRKKAFFRCLRL